MLTMYYLVGGVMVVGSLLAIDLVILPNYSWYRSFRTWLFHLIPYRNAIIATKDGKVGLVTQVNRKRKEVYIHQHFHIDDRQYVRADWVKVSTLTWQPWWTELDGVGL